MLLVVSGGSATASEEQEAPHTTFARSAATAHARLGTPTGKPADASPGPRPLAPHTMARRASLAGEMWRLLRRGVAARPRHRMLLCDQLVGCAGGRGLVAHGLAKEGCWWDDAASRFNSLGSFERACSAFFLCPGRALQPYMPTWGMGLFLMWPLALEQGRLCPTASALAGCLYCTVAVM
jgi:hypothetical protein